MSKDLYVVTKFIMAKSAKEALDKERSCEVDEIYIEPGWKGNKMDRQEPIGFVQKKKKKKET